MATCDIGIVGSGVMGGSLALNLADKGFEVAIYDLDQQKLAALLEKNSSYNNLHGVSTCAEFCAALKKPRKALILVPAGKPTEGAIADLSATMEAEDIVIDCGNAHFKDQTRRAEELESKGLRFLAMGISGGEEGARKGPAFFPGGTLSVWSDVRDIIEAASAKAEDGRPCATMNGSGGAGSCVKMYHNAGEYAVLQIWAEALGVLEAWGVSPERQESILTSWKARRGGSHDGLLNSYMLDITIEVVKMRDSEKAGGASDGSALIEKAMDTIGSKGTGLWSVQEALGVGVPAPSLAEAVITRQMSMYREERLANAEAASLDLPSVECTEDMVEELYWAVALSIIASYAQMFQCLRALDEVHKFGLNLPATIATFRAGCILQGYLLQPMTLAFEANPDLPSLMNAFAAELTENMPKFRRCAGRIVSSTSCACPVILASLGYIQTMHTKSIRSAQAVALQRDVFGRHGFKRLDKEGDFNADWPELQ